MRNILFVILGIFLGVVIESFLGAFVSFSVVFLVILFLFGKIDWKILLAFSVTISLMLYVVSHYVLGIHLLLFSVSILITMSLSLFLPDENSIFGMIPVLISSWIYYILISILPLLISFGEWSGVTLELVFKSLLYAVITVILLWGLDAVLGRLRGDNLSSKLRLR